MAVFTEIAFSAAAELVNTLGVGKLTALKGIASGIENTNYFADTTQGRYVLTLFERLSFEQLPFYLNLMQHLAHKGIAVPEPQANAQGVILHTLHGKPVAVVKRLSGTHVSAPDVSRCTSVGAMLAQMHLAGNDYCAHQPNLRGLAWWQETAPAVQPYLSPDQHQLLHTELMFQQKLAASSTYAALPCGPIHADLFRDNVMFNGHELTGFFDFYFAAVDTFLFDIAVCLNDWCIDPETGSLVEERARAFVAAYDAKRALSADERRLMPALLRAAAVRFWLSRLWDFHLPRTASVLTPHDPVHFERVLRKRIEKPWHPDLTL